ncbi:hypothetical protein [Limnobacter sp.]|uniref:hypothetical protein n=1 Tax=Limnobacter sp. TaxID=2003368 RepID=UPI0025C35D7F|nr:hypothetical protein [Limnobacter sp.]
MKWDSQANFDRLIERQKMGGSFTRDLIAAFFSADWNNKQRLVGAFPDTFIPFPGFDEETILGSRKRVTYPNGYGASIIAMDTGMFEVAVLHDGAVCYDTPLTDDVERFRTLKEAEAFAIKISQLP